MIKKTITYTDYDGRERTEDFFFNLTQAEIVEMQATTVGGFAEMLERIVKSNEVGAIIKIVKEIVLKSYGEKSLDGRRFEKRNGELAAAFSETEAYSKLYMELATDADAAAEFMNGIIPKEAQMKALEGGKQ